MNPAVRKTSIKNRFNPAFFGVAVLLPAAILLSGCGMFGKTADAPVAAGGNTALDARQIAAIIASPDRSAADRNSDERRKPAQILAFIGIRPGMTALDLNAAGGYTTELLARAVGPNGRVYGQSPPPRDANSPPQQPATPEGNAAPSRTAPATAAQTKPAPPAARLTSPQALAARIAATPALENMIAIVRPFENPAPPALAAGGIDLVTLMFNYHDTGHWGIDRAKMNKSIFNALKPGGIYVIADHAGRPGTGISESGTLHRIEEAFLRREVEAAGFRLIDEGFFLRNPDDPRDKNTPEPPQPKDDFILKFVKP